MKRSLSPCPKKWVPLLDAPNHVKAFNFSFRAMKQPTIKEPRKKMNQSVLTAVISAIVAVLTAVISAFTTISLKKAELEKASTTAQNTQEQTGTLIKQVKEAKAQLADSVPNWTPARVEPGWSLYGEPYSDPSYAKDQLRFVHLRGLAKPGAQGQKTPLMFLPDGFRPDHQMQVVVACGGGYPIPCLVVIEKDGRVWFNRLDPHTSWVGLDTVSFTAAQPPNR